MEHLTKLRWSWMNALNLKRMKAMQDRLGSLDTALTTLSPDLLMEVGLKEETALLTMNRLEEFDAAAYEAELKKRDLRLIAIDEDEYPTLLQQVPDAPVFLYVRGNLKILGDPCIALVGTREMSEYGRRVVAHLIPPLVAAGVVTVSGLAYGVDAEVARETLRIGGPTVAVLGHGLGMIYPKAHAKLADEIVKAGGLLLSEFPLDIQPDQYTFPARNRIIAGLSLGTVVVEAAEGSGSLITADLALDYNRDVFAVPGQLFDPNYRGCHQLIGRGQAKLITDASEILAELGVVAPTLPLGDRPTFVAGSEEETKIYGTLSTMPQSLDDLVVKSKLDAAAANATLTILELKGVVRNVGGGQWVRT